MRKRSQRSRRSAPDDDPRTRAIKLLSRREHGAQELRRKLVQRGVDEDDARDAVEGLARDNWQSDFRYACALIRTRAAQHYGPLRVRHELEGAGVAEADIDAAMREETVDWLETARAWAERRLDPPATPAERARNWRKLAARGFDADAIRRVLGEEM